MVEQKTLRDRRIEQNLGLVHTCAGRFRGRGVEYDDLVQAGCVGLCKAADGFDASRGFAFSTYAVPMILGEIRRLFRDGGSVKVGRTLKDRARALLRTQQEIALELGREPTVGELAQRCGTDTSETAFLLGAALPTVSLTAEDDAQNRQIDVPVPPPDAQIEDRVSLQAAIDSLAPDERKLIELRFFRGWTQTKAAEQLGISQVQVSRKEKRILAKMRQALQSE
ncbi:MAG: sigma-70 family RNA polymerase sigma factor [Clostridia bacterium]|nr:sigma-70 family RNA polymerase sigma factor [Clostridia bacterium]